MVSEVSILIPVYNYDITTLVQELVDQCQQASISFEIICLDDASRNNFQQLNQRVKFLNNVFYEELPRNINRAAIRSTLARRAQYSFLLFLDNDSGIISRQFIANYLKVGKADTVLIGGTVYQAEAPAIEYRLHWHYGRKREQRKAEIRQQQAYRQIQVNNLFVSRTLYLANPIPEVVKTYGHEDTLWGKKLKIALVPVLHINNPVCHTGIEPTAAFLTKTEQAITNLVSLNSQKENSLETTLMQSYQFLRKVHAVHLFRWFFKILRPLLLLQLRSSQPSLFLFDIYKLGLLVNAMKKLK